MEDTTMIKKEYMKPTMQVIKTDMKSQILADSITSVTTTGLDAEESLIIDGDDKEKIVWDEAW